MLQNYIKYNTETPPKSTQDCSPLLHYHYVSTLLTMQIPAETLSQSHRLCSIGKERDSETGFSYFGARYYDSDILTGWLSVDPMADKYPNISPYAYCGWTRPTGADEHRLIEFNIANNPVRLVDPDGRDIEIVKDDENKTVSIRGNFYYNKDEIGEQAGVFMKGLEAALDSWSEDIRTALKDESLGAAGYSVNFEFKYIECENPEFSAKSDVDGIGNWVVNDSELPSTTSASVANSRKLRVDFSINRGNIESNPDFYGVNQYQGTLKHEIGHIFGLYDRDPKANNPAPYIPKDLMTYDQGRGNAVEPFKRIWRSVGLNNVGTRRVLINKDNREIKQ